MMALRRGGTLAKLMKSIDRIPVLIKARALTFSFLLH